MVKMRKHRALSILLVLILAFSMLSNSILSAEAKESEAQVITGEAASAQQISSSRDIMLAEDTGIEEIQLSVIYGQTEAREMLSLINDFRTGDDAWYWNSDNSSKTECSGLSELTYDYDLETIAMQRAAEIAIYYSHTRPSGSTCWTAFDENGYSWYAVGENIAAGYTSAASVFAGWQESDEYYSGQGHRRNMLNSSYTSVGVGHVYYNGYHYWVQEFAASNNMSTETAAVDSEIQVPVTIALDNISAVSLAVDPTSYALNVGDSVDLPSLSAEIKMTSSWPGNAMMPITATCIWECADSAFASIEEDQLIAKSAGETELRSTVLGESLSVPIAVAGDDDSGNITIDNPFTDINETDYYYTPVLWAYENEITSGTDATHFAPGEACTRAQVVTFIWRSAGCPEPVSTDNPFTDIYSNDYYYKAVLWAYENGITSGTDATHFSPDETVTRAQVVTFIWRAAGEPVVTSTANPFSDVYSGTYYYDAILWANENGITTGTDASHFGTSENCTRGQVVTFLYRAFS